MDKLRNAEEHEVMKDYVIPTAQKMLLVDPVSVIIGDTQIYKYRIRNLNITLTLTYERVLE